MSKRYEVGYGKPPKATRFRKGQSGNPAGRKKGSKNVSTQVATLIESALAEKVVVNINGKRRTVSKLEAACIQQANRAAGGDAKSMKLLLDLHIGAEPRSRAATDSAIEAVTPEARREMDKGLLDALRAELIGDDDRDA